VIVRPHSGSAVALQPTITTIKAATIKKLLILFTRIPF
jgi:hypothetical protein